MNFTKAIKIKLWVDKRLLILLEILRYDNLYFGSISFANYLFEI